MKLKQGCPLPPIELQWNHYCQEAARPWKEWHARRNMSYVPPQSQRGQHVPHSM